MALKYGVAVKKAKLDAIETTIGASPKLQIRTGAGPTLCSDADTGTLLAEIVLPSDWMDAASNSGDVVTKAQAGTWSQNASGTGTAGHFRLKESNGTVTHMQGSVSLSGNGGDLILSTLTIVSGNAVTVTGFSTASGN